MEEKEKIEETKKIGVLNKFSLDLATLVDKEKRNLEGIHVTSEFTEVTNGAYVLRIDNVKIDPDDYPNGPDGESPLYTKDIDAIIPTEVAKRIQKNIPGIRSASLPILQNAVPGKNTKEDGTNMELITFDLEVWNPMGFRPVEAKFPNIDAVLPKGNPDLELGFNPDFMIKLCQQFKKNGVKTVKLSLYGETSPMQLEGKNLDTDQEIKALLMPCKV